MGYCTVPDLKTHGLNPEAFANKTATARQKAIDSWADFMNGYLGSRYTMPILAPFPPVLVECNAALAAVGLIRSKGIDPEADAIVKTTYEQWLDWLREVRDEAVSPPIVDSSPGATAGSSGSPVARVTSASSRGYSVRGTGRARGPFQSD